MGTLLAHAKNDAKRMTNNFVSPAIITFRTCQNITKHSHTPTFASRDLASRLDR